MRIDRQPTPRWRGLPLLLAFAAGCAHTAADRYETASPTERASFKRVMVPLLPGTRFRISQGAFGKASHSDPGREYSWDFDVPYGTPVLSVEDGKVIGVWEPNHKGGCDAKFNESAHNVKIKHADGTVAQYVHVKSQVKLGDAVRRGQQIAVTAENGFICTPQLDFGIYRSDKHLFGSGQTQTLPLLFEGLPEEGLAREGIEAQVPGLAPPCEGEDYTQKSALLKAIEEKDQADRQDFLKWTPERIIEVGRRDRENRRQVAEIFAQGCLKSADDYLRAALVFQHGEVPEHYFQAYIWALKAHQMGKRGAGIMAANGIDRYLMNLGQKQLFGGQATTAREGAEKEQGCFCLWPIEKSFPESKRREFEFRSRQELAAWIAELNRGKSGCTGGECKVKAKTAVRGSVPGLW